MVNAKSCSKVPPANLWMKRLRPPKSSSGGCKIELRGVPHPGGCKIEHRRVPHGLVEVSGRLLGARLVSPRPLRNRPWAALGARLAALEPVFWRSWRVLGPFSGGSPASGGSRGSSGRPFLDGYCGGGAQEPGNSTNVADFLYLGEQVVALMFGLFFLPCDAASGEGNFENR